MPKTLIQFILIIILIQLLFLVFVTSSLYGKIKPIIYITEFTPPEGEIEWVTEKIIILGTTVKNTVTSITLTCNSSTPIDWSFNTTQPDPNYAKPFGRKRHINLHDPYNISSYIYEISVKILTFEYTQQGIYICKSFVDSSIYDNVYVQRFHNYDHRRYLIQNQLSIRPKLDETVILIPCIFQFDSKHEPTLMKVDLENTEIQINMSEQNITTYDSTKGFYLQIINIVDPWGDYRCVQKYGRKSWIKMYIPVKLLKPTHPVITLELGYRFIDARDAVIKWTRQLVLFCVHQILLSDEHRFIHEIYMKWLRINFHGIQYVTCASNQPIQIRATGMPYFTLDGNFKFLGLLDEEPNVTYFQNNSSVYRYNAFASISFTAGCYTNNSLQELKVWGLMPAEPIRLLLGEYGQGQISCLQEMEKLECNEPAECNFLKNKFKNDWYKEVSPGLLEVRNWRTRTMDLERYPDGYTYTSIAMKPIVVRCVSRFRSELNVISDEHIILFDLNKNFFVFNKDNNGYNNSKLVEISKYQTDAYQFENINFTCIATRFLFSYVYWAFHFYNGSVVFLSTFEVNDNIQFFGVIQERTTMLEINDLNISAISCYAPFWNSFKWNIATINITVKEKQPPQIDGSDNIEYVELPPVGQDLKLLCNVTSHPKPIINWTGNFIDGVDAYIETVIQSPTKTVSVLVLPGKNERSEGDYICNTENIFGITRKMFRTMASKENLPPTLIVAIVASIIATVILTFLLFLRHRRQLANLKNRLTEKDINDFLKGSLKLPGTSSTDPQSKNFPDEYKITRKQIKIDNLNMLGYGAYGIVYCGTYHPHSRDSRHNDDGIENENIEKTVAIKTLKQGADVQYVKSLLAEIKAMVHVGSHEFIVNFFGACIHNIRYNEINVVLEFCNNGNLEKYLRNHRRNFADTDITQLNHNNIPEGKITTRNLLYWSQHIAYAMKYLAEKNVIHGDLATRNVLLTENLVAKVADFGLAKHLYNYSKYIRKGKQILPWAWMAIESLKDQEFSIRSDIWSFGVTLWEIFSLGEVPYGGLGFSMDFVNMLKLGLRLPKPAHSSDQMYEVMIKCWNTDSTKRPTIETIESLLHIIGTSSMVNLSSTSSKLPFHSLASDSDDVKVSQLNNKNMILIDQEPDKDLVPVHDDISLDPEPEYLLVVEMA